MSWILSTQWSNTVEIFFWAALFSSLFPIYFSCTVFPLLGLILTQVSYTTYNVSLSYWARLVGFKLISSRQEPLNKLVKVQSAFKWFHSLCGMCWSILIIYRLLLLVFFFFYIYNYLYIYVNVACGRITWLVFFFFFKLFLFIRDLFLVILLTVCKVNKFEFYSLGFGPLHWDPHMYM